MTDYLGDLGKIASDHATAFSPISGSLAGNQRGGGGGASAFESGGFDGASIYSGMGAMSSSGAIVTGTAVRAISAPSAQPPMLVADVRAGVSAMRFAPYIKHFDEEAAAAAIAMCSVPVQTVEDAARAQLLTFDIAREDQAMQHRNNLIKVAELRRNRLTELDQKRHEHDTAQAQSLRAIGLVQQQTSDLVSTYYDLAEREMAIHLVSRKSEVQRTIGEIRKWHYADDDPNKPNWNHIEQEVQIQVCKLRGVKNKIPRGRYVLLMTKWEKLGLDATPLNWSKKSVFDSPPPSCTIHSESKNVYEKLQCEVCTGVCGATHILKHEGLATDYEINFNSRTYTSFPSSDDIKPYNVLVFELARLPNPSEWREDQPFRPTIVGWGAMPIVDSRFEVVNGKFRLPMLRGPYKPEFGHYYALQEAITSDIENWLCNLYVDIYPHARTYYGQSEFDMERAFARNLLNLGSYPSAHDQEGWPLEKRKRGLSLKGSIDPLVGLKRNATMTHGGGGRSARTAMIGTSGGSRTAGAAMTATAGASTIMGGTMGTTMGMFEDEEFPYVRPTYVPMLETPALTRWNMLRLAVDHHTQTKKHNLIEAQRDAIKRVEQQKRFRYAIHPLGATNIGSVWSIQVEYCKRAILDDLDVMRPLSGGFWLNIAVFLIALLFQVYVHGLFVYFALYVTSTPVQRLEPRWFGLNVVYSHLKTYQVEELFVVFMSMASTYFFLIVEILIGVSLRYAMKQTPEKLSKFVFTTAISAMLVPVIEIIIDAGSGSDNLRRSDWYRLHDFFIVHEYGAYFTVIIWFLLYGLLAFGSVVTTFLYTMRLHLNGILQDAFWRIMVVNEATCFLPDDLEISVSELQHILLHAERWRGKNGERRKIIVERLTTTDAQDSEYKREDMHIRIVQLDCGNSRRWWKKREQLVHREFFITQDGTVLELMAGEGGGSQGMQGAAIGIGFLLNNLANTSKKTMDVWKGVLDGSGRGDASTIGGAGESRGPGFFGFSMTGKGGATLTASGHADDEDEALDAGERRGVHLRGATSDRAGGRRTSHRASNAGINMDFASSFSNSFY